MYGARELHSSTGRLQQELRGPTHGQTHHTRSLLTRIPVQRQLVLIFACAVRVAAVPPPLPAARAKSTFSVSKYARALVTHSNKASLGVYKAFQGAHLVSCRLLLPWFNSRAWHRTMSAGR